MSEENKIQQDTSEEISANDSLIIQNEGDKKAIKDVVEEVNNDELEQVSKQGQEEEQKQLENIVFEVIDVEAEVKTNPEEKNIQVSSTKDKEVINENKPFYEVFDSYIEKCVDNVFFWKPTTERGKSIYNFLHHGVLYLFIALYIISHTIYPSFFIVCILYVFAYLYWMFIIMHGYSSIRASESNFLKSLTSFIDPLFQMFDITVADDTSLQLILFITTIGMFFLTFEVTSQCMKYALSLVSSLSF